MVSGSGRKYNWISTKGRVVSPELELEMYNLLCPVEDEADILVEYPEWMPRKYEIENGRELTDREYACYKVYKRLRVKGTRRLEKTIKQGLPLSKYQQQYLNDLAYYDTRIKLRNLAITSALERAYKVKEDIINEPEEFCKLPPIGSTVQDILRQKGVDPASQLVLIAMTTEDEKLKVAILRDLLAYTHPKKGPTTASNLGNQVALSISIPGITDDFDNAHEYRKEKKRAAKRKRPQLPAGGNIAIDISSSTQTYDVEPIKEHKHEEVAIPANVRENLERLLPKGKIGYGKNKRKEKG